MVLGYFEFTDPKFPLPKSMETISREMPEPPDVLDAQAMDIDLKDEDMMMITKSPEPLEKMDIESADQDLLSKELSKQDPKTPEKEIKIACLESIDSLKKKCEADGLEFNEAASDDDDDDDDDTAYEVDVIYGHKVIEGEKYYCIKWKNYRTEANTWEPTSHLEDCTALIAYYNSLKYGSKNTGIKRNVLNYFVRDLVTRKPYDILTLTKTCALFFEKSEKYVVQLKLSVTELKDKVKEGLNFSDQRIKKMLEKLYPLMRFAEKRKRVLIELKEWEDDINAANTSANLITVENTVDLESYPRDFVFVQDYINRISPNPIIPEPVIFCSCEEDCYKNRDDCCPNESDGLFAYNRHKKLNVEPGYPIFECNDRCTCPPTCINRVVQHGQRVKVAIFRTSDKGWGLRALETIERGQFVLEYLGEIITSEVAEARGYIYDYVGRSYLFDLDYNVDNESCCYTVDARQYGNASHFINHSCDPNLHVFAVWINQQDPRLPRLAFFARRRIVRGEELTFDYKMSKDHFSGDTKIEDNGRLPCKCKARNCKKYLF